ncbi:DUF892 family protein [Aurantimonas sp. MSK8Z-1]|uniref:YciE/YciF ferroxidase family protein n=1 Tax=Mangrovibrevibacter kandeliae TaxID=2968473 RepID=UPI0021176980|nr:DUF892 family protein [Aurantimonas sp. MSK8Z-1]MCW4114854.1 DUF892 family protein [Aurantimonas sp. MSK8Z-1]
MPITTLKDMYVAELRRAHRLEQLLAEALPLMEQAASERRLKLAFRSHAEETEEHEEQVAAILDDLLDEDDAGDDAASDDDATLSALVAEWRALTAGMRPGPLRDAVLIAAAQRIEHYEIAIYGTLAAHATTFEREEEAQILEGILDEERDTDDLLTDLAEGVVNPAAIEAELT